MLTLEFLLKLTYLCIIDFSYSTQHAQGKIIGKQNKYEAITRKLFKNEWENPVKKGNLSNKAKQRIVMIVCLRQYKRIQHGSHTCTHVILC